MFNETGKFLSVVRTRANFSLSASRRFWRLAMRHSLRNSVAQKKRGYLSAIVYSLRSESLLHLTPKASRNDDARIHRHIGDAASPFPRSDLRCDATPYFHFATHLSTESEKSTATPTAPRAYSYRNSIPRVFVFVSLSIHALGSWRGVSTRVSIESENWERSYIDDNGRRRSTSHRCMSRNERVVIFSLGKRTFPQECVGRHVAFPKNALPENRTPETRFRNWKALNFTELKKNTRQLWQAFNGRATCHILAWTGRLINLTMIRAPGA